MSKKEIASGHTKQQANLLNSSGDFLQKSPASETKSTLTLAELGAQLTEHCLPAWNDIPDFGLYMDQVLVLVNRYLGDYPGQEDNQLTGAMVNNYVKMGIVPAPVKKKYSRTHIVHLLVICTLKSVLPIDSINKLLQNNLAAYPDAVFYDSFAAFYRQSNQETAAALQSTEADTLQTILLAALRSQAEQAIAAAALTTVTLPYKVEKKTVKQK